MRAVQKKIPEHKSFPQKTNPQANPEICKWTVFPSTFLS